MANQAQIQEAYDYLDELIQINLGKYPDFSNAFYNGDYSLTLEGAQKAKHRYILDGIGFKDGFRVLDIGCGWGPMLNAVRDRGGTAIGITLSPKQVESCRRSGLQAYLHDWKELTVGDFGKFDGIVSVGAFEHFCSTEEYLAGHQSEIYQRFFDLCHDLLPDDGRIYLHTSVWYRNVPAYQQVSLKEPKGSSERNMALMEIFFPGSWPPVDKEQVVNSARGFEMISAVNGRLDYIQTTKEWGRCGRQLSPHKIWAMAKLAVPNLANRNFWYRMEYGRNCVFSTCLELEILDNWRFIFERRPDR
ncbi:MAG: class I SAM-dependent methyltransferase [Chloroflexi bacterium]|nr:class I SAM-dependent methyltransferase [Chloroflexota bacterium]